MVYDCVIIGSGPAGVSAALNLKIHNKNFVFLGSAALSERISRAERVMNYPGLPAVTGQELGEAFRTHLAEMDIAITEKMVTSIMPMGEAYAVLAQDAFYETRTVILTTGVAATATLPGETEMLGHGISYCATCDGGLYRGRRIGVILGSARFAHEARYLAGLAREVVLYPAFRGEMEMPDNVLVSADRPVEVLHDNRVTGLRLKSGAEEPLDGVFILRDSIALSTLLGDLKTEDGHIAVDRTMATNLRGIFAAGDCTGRPYQYTKAVGEGNVAAHSVIDYLG